MAIISFWSDQHKETGKSTSLAAIATYMAINNTYKMLMFNTAFNDSTLKDCFFEQRKDTKYNFKLDNRTDLDTGIKGLSKAILSNKTSPEIITNYTTTIFKGRLELLTEDEIMYEEYLKQRTTFKEIAKMANKYYDLVFIDLAQIKDDNVANEILDLSNIIVVNLNQNIKSFNKYLNVRKKGIFMDKKNLILLLGRADLDSKYNARNLSREISEKDIYMLPYTTVLYEAANEGQVAEYFMKFRSKTGIDINKKFMNSVQEISERILERIKELQMGM